ncbi:MAG: hypothetical protein PHT88_03925 [Candidatus Moranbacteria bacterium]|nr:hypothetical protein [Candidatus Moranbacteria bacterium]
MWKNSVFLFSILFVLFGMAEEARAADHYVRTGATGSANGNDWTNAYADLPQTLVRGDVYYIADGTYQDRLFGTALNGTKTITIKKAIASDHGAAADWQAQYGDGQANFGNLEFSTGYWVFDGQTGGGPGSWNSGFGFRLNHTSEHGVVLGNNADNVTMRHVEVIGNLTDGVQGFRLTGADNFTLSYYSMNQIGNCPFFLVPVSNFVAEYGYVGKFSGSGANHSEIASIWGGVTGSMTFRYNVFTSVTSTGGIMWDNNNDHNARLNVYGNVFANLPSSGVWDNGANGLIGGWTGGNGEDFYNAKIYNNSFINTSGRIFTDFITRSGDNVAANNLFYNSSAPGYADIQTHNYNHYINSGGSQGEANGTSSSGGDPFVDYVNLNFALKAATAAGQTLGSPYTLDALGITRGADGTWDRGAFEFGSEGLSDTVAPIITQVAAIQSITRDNTPNYTFSSTEAGVISYVGDCSVTNISAANANNAITLNALKRGTHSDCSIKVTDAANNQSASLSIPPFTITFRSDLNLDRSVNVSDFGLLNTYYGTGNSAGDINLDGKVDMIDFGIMRTEYGGTM